MWTSMTRIQIFPTLGYPGLPVFFSCRRIINQLSQGLLGRHNSLSFSSENVLFVCSPSNLKSSSKDWGMFSLKWKTPFHLGILVEFSDVLKVLSVNQRWPAPYWTCLWWRAFLVALTSTQRVWDIWALMADSPFMILFKDKLFLCPPPKFIPRCHLSFILIKPFFYPFFHKTTYFLTADFLPSLRCQKSNGLLYRQNQTISEVS